MKKVFFGLVILLLGCNPYKKQEKELDLHYAYLNQHLNNLVNVNGQYFAAANAENPDVFGRYYKPIQEAYDLKKSYIKVIEGNDISLDSAKYILEKFEIQLQELKEKLNFRKTTYHPLPPLPDNYTSTSKVIIINQILSKVYNFIIGILSNFCHNELIFPPYMEVKTQSIHKDTIKILFQSYFYQKLKKKTIELSGSAVNSFAYKELPDFAIGTIVLKNTQDTSSIKGLIKGERGNMYFETPFVIKQPD